MQKKRIFSYRAVRPAPVVLAAAVLGFGNAALAFQLDTGNPDVRATWDNTVKYSAAWRLHNPDSTLTSNINNDDGDRNFKKGLVSSRVDWLSELDLSYRNVGARISAAAWYDSAYNRSNDYPASLASSNNNLSVPYNQFTEATRHIHGKGAEFLDAFVYGKFDLGEQRAIVRAGKHALVWGESLFFGGNAIAGGMSPVDVVKLQSVPNTQFKEATRPVPQISGQLQLTSDVSIGGYYQFRWAPNRLPAVGSYFSPADVNPDGAEQLLIPGFVNPILRVDDQRARNSGQGGLQLRMRVDETDYGLYLIRFHDKAFQQVTNLGTNFVSIPFVGNIPVTGAPVSYRLAYHEGITAFGGSFSRSFGDVNVAGEASLRHNQDLASSAGAHDVSGGSANNNSNNPAYATGNTAHANLSVLWSLQPNAFFNEANVAAEMAWNRVLHVEKNLSAIDARATRDAVAFRGVFTPVYRQVMPGLDLEVPIGLGFSPKGSRSMAIGPGTFPSDGGGDLSIGVNGIYLDVWRFSLSYTHFFGPEDTFTNAANGYTYKQSLHDRDFIAFSVRTTF